MSQNVCSICGQYRCNCAANSVKYDDAPATPPKASVGGTLGLDQGDGATRQCCNKCDAPIQWGARYCEKCSSEMLAAPKASIEGRLSGPAPMPQESESEDVKIDPRDKEVMAHAYDHAQAMWIDSNHKLLAKNRALEAQSLADRSELSELREKVKALAQEFHEVSERCDKAVAFSDFEYSRGTNTGKAETYEKCSAKLAALLSK